MRMICFLLTVWLLGGGSGGPGNLVAQGILPSRTMENIDKCRREVDKIHGMELRRVFLGWSGKYIVEEHEWSEWLVTLYFDGEGRLRKCVRQSSYPEGDSMNRLWFDTAGLTVYGTYGCLSGHDGDISRVFYRYGEDGWYYSDRLEQWGDGSDALVEYRVRNGFFFPGEAGSGEDGDIRYTFPGNVGELIGYSYGMDEVDSLPAPLRYTAVRFGAAAAGERTSVNRNKVPVYLRATDDSRVVGWLKVSDEIRVVTTDGAWALVERPESGYEEREDHYSGYPLIRGYVRRECLEPVERR